MLAPGAQDVAKEFMWCLLGGSWQAVAFTAGFWTLGDNRVWSACKQGKGVPRVSPGKQVGEVFLRY